MDTLDKKFKSMSVVFSAKLKINEASGQKVALASQFTQQIHRNFDVVLRHVSHEHPKSELNPSASWLCHQHTTQQDDFQTGPVLRIQKVLISPAGVKNSIVEDHQ